MDDTTTINVKGIRKGSWQAATRAASQPPKTLLGPWLSDAIDQRLYREARGDNLDEKVPQYELNADQFTARILAMSELAKSIAALKVAGCRPVGISALSRELAILYSRPKLTSGRKVDIEGEAEPLTPGKDRGKEPAKETGPLIEADSNVYPIGFALGGAE